MMSRNRREGDERILATQIREVYGRICYTHKTHEKQADIYFRRDHRQRRIRVVVTAVSSGAFLVSLLGLFLDDRWVAVFTSFVAVLITGSTLSAKAFEYGEGMQKHREAASTYWDIRESYLSLIVDLKSGVISATEARNERDRLQTLTHQAAADAPRTTGEAYGLAQKALKLNEELTFTADEIDHLLPTDLRLSREVRDDSGR